MPDAVADDDGRSAVTEIEGGGLRLFDVSYAERRHRHGARREATAWSG
jgi:hypothetical protein